MLTYARIMQLVDTDSILSDSAWVASSLALTFALGIVFFYIALEVFFRYKMKLDARDKLPPTIPYMIPFLGNLWRYLQDPIHFIDSFTPTKSNRNPVGVRMFSTKLILVIGEENISALWKNSYLSTSMAMYYFVLTRLFGMPKKAAARVAQLDSGFSPRLYPGTKDESRNRVDFLVFHNLLRLTQGPGFNPFYRRFATGLHTHISEVDIGSEWRVFDDFWKFLALSFMPSSLQAMCEPFLVRRTSKFCHRFWDYVSAVPNLARGWPRWLDRASYEIRDSLLQDIKAWHVWARENFNEDRIGEDGDYDPYFGSSFIRERQAFIHKIDDFDEDAVAAEDLGAIFGANANAIPSVFWALYYTYLDPEVLKRARLEANVAREPSFDETALVTRPLLQSIYCEVLHLHVAAYIGRYTEREELQLGPWRLPKREAIIIPTSIAHMDKSVWNEGQHGERPVDKFWADRFLVYPNQPYSGPRKHNGEVKDVGTEKAGDNNPQFTLEGMQSAWIPYGGGPRICPGRHFAKRQILFVLALIVTIFDVEFLDHDPVGVGKSDFGLGVQKPARKTAFRIRRREDLGK